MYTYGKEHHYTVRVNDRQFVCQAPISLVRTYFQEQKQYALDALNNGAHGEAQSAAGAISVDLGQVGHRIEIDCLVARVVTVTQKKKRVALQFHALDSTTPPLYSPSHVTFTAVDAHFLSETERNAID